MLAVITTSNRKDKKYVSIIVSDGKVKTVQFGASGYEDFTTHKDENRKEKYIKRHQKNEDWDDPYKPGFWAKNLLWNKISLEDSAKDIEEKFNIKIILAV
jgi:hypothetical protein